MFTEIVDSTFYFLWQDNNTVLGLTIVYCLKNDIVKRLRKRSSPTSVNVQIVRPVFDDESFKWLHIPRVIDDYNHYMNDVDRNNQLRKNFTVHRPYERRIRRPLWYYILDVCTVNVYLIWKGNKVDQNKRGQRRFRETLINTLLNTPYVSSPPPLSPSPSPSPPPPPPIPQSNQVHYWERFEKRGYCIWCQNHTEKRGVQTTRPVLGEIVNNAAPTKRLRSKRSLGGCRICSAYLCVKGACFRLYYSNSSIN